VKLSFLFPPSGYFINYIN